MKPGEVDWGWLVNRWRRKVKRYWKPEDVEVVLGIIYYESRGWRWCHNVAEDSRGLMQMRQLYWPGRAKAAGWAGYSAYNGEANIAVGAWLCYNSWDIPGAPHWHHWYSTYGRALAAVERGHL